MGYEFYPDRWGYELYLDHMGYELYRTEMNYEIFYKKMSEEFYQRKIDDVLYDPELQYPLKIIDIKKRRISYYKKCIHRGVCNEKKIFTNNVKRRKKQQELESLWKHLGPGNNISPRSIMKKSIKKHFFMINYCKKYNLCKENLEFINHLCPFECKPSLAYCIGEFNYDIKNNQKRFLEFIEENIDKDWVKNYLVNNKLKYKIE